MYFTTETVGAQQLSALGSLIAVVPNDQLLAEARRDARLISRHSPAIMRMAKRALRGIEGLDLQAGYIYEQALTTELAGEPESVAARAAALQHRHAHYRAVTPEPPYRDGIWPGQLSSRLASNPQSEQFGRIAGGAADS